MNHFWVLSLAIVFTIIAKANAGSTNINQMVNQGGTGDKKPHGGAPPPPPPPTTTTEHPGSTTSPPPCRDIYDYTEDGHQYLFYNETKNYTDADNACQMVGARLVHMFAFEDYVHFTRFRAAAGAVDDQLWIGLTNPAPYVMEWTNGQSFTMDPVTGLVDGDNYMFTNFEGRSSYSSTSTPKCIQSDNQSDLYLWDRYSCDDEKKFICECPQ